MKSLVCSQDLPLYALIMWVEEVTRRERRRYIPNLEAHWSILGIYWGTPEYTSVYIGDMLKITEVYWGYTEAHRSIHRNNPGAGRLLSDCSPCVATTQYHHHHHTYLTYLPDLPTTYLTYLLDLPTTYLTYLPDLINLNSLPDLPRPPGLPGPG